MRGEETKKRRREEKTGIRDQGSGVREKQGSAEARKGKEEGEGKFRDSQNFSPVTIIKTGYKNKLDYGCPGNETTPVFILEKED